MLVFHNPRRGPLGLVQVRHTELRDAVRKDGDLPRTDHLLVGVSLPGNPVRINGLFTFIYFCFARRTLALKSNKEILLQNTQGK